MTSSVPLETGSFVGNRFVFEEQIGRGGMGTVFKARDLRKEEAGDPNPRVAIKILNEEFKRHPNAVQALQREARKAQNIAHPNIVTVYDFDRDGSEVYMVMELLEGQPLDRIIKDAENIGVGFKEALRITSAVGDAMAYAHERGIIHADFKPANVFVTREGVVKVLDFGIARAVKVTDLGDGGPLTVFDPGDLGALTPAYAGHEVIEGQEPDIRDDIYAIACVFYELMTGKHPYNRRSAEDASKEGLLPARPKGLSRSQWKMLRSALEFRRDNRPASVQQFVEALVPKRRTAAWYFGLAAAASIVIVCMMSTMHVMSSHDRAVSDALMTNDTSKIAAVMPWLRELTPERRSAIFVESAARAGLIKYFTERVDAAVDPQRDRYEYAQADALIKDLWELLPDSQAVRALTDRVSARRAYALQRERFTPTFAEINALDALTSDEKLKEFGTLLRSVPRASAPKSSRTKDEWRSLQADMSANANTAAFLAAAWESNPAAPTVSLEPLPAKSAPEKASPAAAAVSYLHDASAAVMKGRLEDAYSLADSAYKLVPASREAAAARDRYSRYLEIDSYLQTRDHILTPHIRYKIWRVSKLAPNEMPAVTQRWQRVLITRVQSARDPKQAAHFTQVSQTIFKPEPTDAAVAADSGPQR